MKHQFKCAYVCLNLLTNDNSNYQASVVILIILALHTHTKLFISLTN